MADSQLHVVINYCHFHNVTLFWGLIELPHQLQLNIQLRKLHQLTQHFMILQLRHTSLIAQSVKEIRSDHETGLIDTDMQHD